MQALRSGRKDFLEAKAKWEANHPDEARAVEANRSRQSEHAKLLFLEQETRLKRIYTATRRYDEYLEELWIKHVAILKAELEAEEKKREDEEILAYLVKKEAEVAAKARKKAERHARTLENKKAYVRKYQAKRYAEHKEEYKTRVAEWRAKHPEYSRQHYAEHREECKASVRRWMAKHPNKVAAYHENRRARIEGASGSFTAKEWRDLKKKYGRRCLCCGRDDVKLTVDHVIPISMDGSNNIENIQPLCWECNSAKHTQTIDFRLTADRWVNQ